MGRRGGSHAGTLTKLSMKFLATKGFCKEHSPFCPHLFLREGSLDGRICFSSSFIFFFLEPDTWTHFHSCTPNTFPQQCWISLCNIHRIPWKCRAFSEDLIYGNIIIGGYHALVSMIMWHSLNMSNLGSRKLQTFFNVFKAAYNWTPRREQLRKWKTQWLRQRIGLSKRWYIRGWGMGISTPATSSSTNFDRSGCTTPWQDQNLYRFYFDHDQTLYGSHVDMKWNQGNVHLGGQNYAKSEEWSLLMRTHKIWISWHRKSWERPYSHSEA